MKLEIPLVFQNPVFNKDVNVTCRAGKKWMQAVAGDTVRVEDFEGTSFFGEATILHVGVYPFLEDIPETLLAFEHDPECRDHAGLAKEMERIYGDLFGQVIVVLVFAFGE